MCGKFGSSANVIDSIVILSKWSMCVKSLSEMFKCLDSGVDLSYIVKAAPAAPSNEEQEEQMHEILQVSFAPF